MRASLAVRRGPPARPGWAWHRRTPAARPRSRRQRWRTRRSSRGPSRPAGRGRGRHRRRRRRRGRRRPRPGAGATTSRLSGVATSTPSPPILTSASSTPRSSSRVAASCGSLVPTATSTSARLPTATVTWSSIASYSARGLLGRRPEHRPPVEVEHGVASRPVGGAAAVLEHRELGGARRARRSRRCRSPRTRARHGRGPTGCRRRRSSGRARSAAGRRAAAGPPAGRARRRRPGSAGPPRSRRTTRRRRSPSSASRTKSPNPSGPTFVSTAVRRPSRAAPTATLVAVPPRNLAKVETSLSGPFCCG